MTIKYLFELSKSYHRFTNVRNSSRVISGEIKTIVCILFRWRLIEAYKIEEKLRISKEYRLSVDQSSNVNIYIYS